MNEEQKIRTEKAFECLDAVLSSVRAGKRWLEQYYPADGRDSVEDQSLVELTNNLAKAETVCKNLANTLLSRIEMPKDVKPFVEVENAS